jgi:hypothetical protein
MYIMASLEEKVFPCTYKWTKMLETVEQLLSGVQLLENF